MGFKPFSDIFAISPTLKRSGKKKIRRPPLSFLLHTITSSQVTTSFSASLMSQLAVTIFNIRRQGALQRINHLRALGCSERLQLSQAVET